MYFYRTLSSLYCLFFIFFFFFNDTATTEIYTLSLHDALPIFVYRVCDGSALTSAPAPVFLDEYTPAGDRKSTRLNSSHLGISYAVFCLKKKKKKINNINYRLYPNEVPIEHDTLYSQQHCYMHL